MDNLEQVFNTQAEFQSKLGYNFNKMSVAECTAYVKEYGLHMEHEMHEMLAELPFLKPWKRYPTDADEQWEMVEKARAEWIDAFHFFINISIALGFTAEELCLGYMAKHEVNEQRQAETDFYKKCTEVSCETSCDG